MMRRALLGGVPHLVAAAPTVTVLIAERDRLPERMASHFAVDGTADGYAGHGAVLALAVGLGIGMAVVFALVAALSARSGAVSRWDVPRGTIALSWGVAALLGVTQFAAVEANLSTTVVLPVWTLLAALGAAVVAGAVGWLVAPRTPPGAREPAPVAAVPIGATEQISWSGSASSWWPPVLGALLLAGGITLAVTSPVVAGVVLIVLGALLLLQGRVRVTVDRRGLTVALGLVGLPRVHIPVDDIASATAADVSPASFGGWGYRFVPGGSGVILRSGPALIVTRRSGRRFTVSVDDAETAAGVLGGVAGRAC